MRIFTAFIAAFLTLTGVAHATTYPLKVIDFRGKSITIKHEPKRIVSISPATTEIAYALGLESRIVGVTKYCNYPAQAKMKPKVGDRTTSVETIISLKPDLILAHGFLNDSAIRSLESHGFTVLATDPKTLAQAQADILLIGRATNREAQSRKSVGRISSALALVKKRLSNVHTRPKVLVAVEADPLWAAGPKTFVDEIIRAVGATNVAGDAKPGFNQFSAEAVIVRNPDVIIGTAKGDKKVFTRGFWKDTTAAKSGRVYEADSDLFVRPGPRLADGILLFARLAHPDVFKN